MGSCGLGLAVSPAWPQSTVQAQAPAPRSPLQRLCLWAVVLRAPLWPGGRARKKRSPKGPGRAVLGSKPLSRILRPRGAAKSLQGQKRRKESHHQRPLGQPLAANPTGIVLTPSRMLLRGPMGPCSTAYLGRSGGTWAGLWAGGGVGVESVPQSQPSCS